MEGNQSADDVAVRDVKRLQAGFRLVWQNFQLE
jgi:hypothetical protein